MSVILLILLLGCVGYIIILRVSVSSLIENAEEKHLNSESDRQHWANALLREIGNEIISRDRQFYVDKFKSMVSEWTELKNSGKDEFQKRLNEISIEYPMYLDFDYLQSWPHQIYADRFSWASTEELWGIYKDIKIFHAVKRELDKNLETLPSPFSEEELKHLAEYVQTIENTELLAHLHNAMDEYNLLNGNEVEWLEGDWIYETRKYKFKHVSHYAESRIGVYIKDLKKYGLWGRFIDGDKAYYSFYATNEKFEEQEDIEMDSLSCRYSLAKE